MKKNGIICLKALSFICILGVSIVIIGCNDYLEDFNFDEKTFMANWNAWNNQNIKNYSFTLEESFYGIARGVPDLSSYEWKIIVKNGVMDSFEYFFYEGDYFPEESYKSVPPFTSISDMFQKIYNDVNAQKEYQRKRPDRTVEYILKYNNELNFITFYTVNVYIPNMSAWPMSPFRVLNFTLLD